MPRAPAGRPRPAPTDFSYEVPVGLINLMSSLLGQGQQGQILIVAVRSFLEGKGWPADVGFNLQITAARVRSVPSNQTVDDVLDLDALAAQAVAAAQNKENHNGTG